MCKILLRTLSAGFVALMLIACESDNDSGGSLVIERDLRLSSLSIDAGDVSPTFDPDSPGPYEIVVATDVSEVSFTVGTPAETDGVGMLAFRRVEITNDERDGRVDEQEITPESTFSFTVTPGENLFAIRVQLNNEQQFIDYLVSVRRISTEATLANIVFEDFTTSEDEDIDLVSPATFSSDVFEYTLSAPFSRCTVGVSAFGSSRFTQLSLNGDDIERGEITYLDLAVGENVVSVGVTAEDGSATNTYQFTITRDAATSTDNEDNATLSALNISTGELRSNRASEGFDCLISTYVLRVDNNQTSVDISAIPTIDGRTVELASVVTTQDENGNDVPSLENPRSFVTGEALTVEISDDDAENNYAISVLRSDDDTLQAHYNLSLVRSDTNWVRVSTGAELQAALQNAEPNQEILIESSQALTADATLAASGKEGVHFYASASGTAEQPIILRGFDDVTLAGTDLSSGTVLELAGDYWEVRDLILESAAYGLVLDSASNNDVTRLEIRDVGLRGVQVKNGSNNNYFNALDIENIGAAASAEENAGQALVVGSAPVNWNSNPVPGTDEPSNTANTFFNFDIGPNVLGEPVAIEAGSVSTELFGFMIDAAGISSDVADVTTGVRVQGNDSELSYSTITDSGASLGSAVYVDDIDEAWVTEAWAEDTQVFDNVLDTSQANLPFVLANENVETVFVDDNTRVDAQAVTYSGAAIDEGFSSPLFRIEWVSTEDAQTYCLQREVSTVTDTETEVTLVTAAACDGSSAQQWDLIHEGEGSLVIRSQAVPTAKLTPSGDGAFRSQNVADTLTFKEDADTTDFASASSLRWRVNYDGRDRVYITNEFGPGFGITMLDSSVYSTDNFVATISVLSLADSQIFRLVPIE